MVWLFQRMRTSAGYVRCGYARLCEKLQKKLTENNHDLPMIIEIPLAEVLVAHMNVRLGRVDKEGYLTTEIPKGTA